MAERIDRTIAAEQKRSSPKSSASGISKASSSGSAKEKVKVEVGKGTVRPPHRL